MKENLNEERAIDTVGRPKGDKVSEGNKPGKASSKMEGGSQNGIGGGLTGNAMVDEPIFHEPAYRRSGGDKNSSSKAETGTPRQEAGYRNRNNGASGQNMTNDSRYQDKLPSFPKKNPATKQSADEDF